MKLINFTPPDSKSNTKQKLRQNWPFSQTKAIETRITSDMWCKQEFSKKDAAVDFTEFQKQESGRNRIPSVAIDMTRCINVDSKRSKRKFCLNYRIWSNIVSVFLFFESKLKLKNLKSFYASCNKLSWEKHSNQFFSISWLVYIGTSHGKNYLVWPFFFRTNHVTTKS